MPRVFKMGPYLVYFWSDECEPLEPVHVHISVGEPVKDATKVWLTKSGGVLLENKDSRGRSLFGYAQSPRRDHDSRDEDR